MKTHLAFRANNTLLGAAIAVSLATLTSLGWARDAPPAAPHVNDITSPDNLIRDGRHTTDWVSDGVMKRKLYANGKRIGTQMIYGSTGTTVTYRRGSHGSMPVGRWAEALLGKEIVDRFSDADFRGPAMRLVTTTNKDGSKTTRAYVMESHTGRHDGNGEIVANGFDWMKRHQWTRVNYQNGTRVLYSPRSNERSGRLRTQTITSIKHRPTFSLKQVSPRIRARR